MQRKHIALLNFTFVSLLAIYSCEYSSSTLQKIYDLKELETTRIRIPPISHQEAIHVAYTIPEVKAAMKGPNQRLIDWVDSTSRFLKRDDITAYWIATVDRSRDPDVSKDNWHIVFRTSLRPAYICDIRYSDNEIAQGKSHVECGYERK